MVSPTARRAVVLALAGLTVWVSETALQGSLAAQVPQPIVDEFGRRVDAYVAIRAAALAGLPGGGDRAAPEMVMRRRASLNDRLREKRRNEQPGAILFPAFIEAVVPIFRTDPFAITGREAAAMALETKRPPDNVPVPRVNQDYPKDFGLVSPPATILIRLPDLPDGLEYRLIGPHLVLRDAGANLIVDVAPNVLRSR